MPRSGNDILTNSRRIIVCPCVLVKELEEMRGEECGFRDLDAHRRENHTESNGVRLICIVAHYSDSDMTNRMSMGGESSTDAGKN